MAKSPFFIIGCARSGNTLLRLMLNRHPQIAIPVESLFITDYLRAKPTIPFYTIKKLFVKEYEIKEWGIHIHEEDFAGCQTRIDLINRVHEVYLKHHQKTIWGQKTPRFIRYVHELKHVYSWAKFIHIIRDPRAVVSSLIEANTHYSNAYYGAMRWVNDVNFGVAFKQQYPESVLEVRYEELVSEPEKVLHEICTFLQITFAEHMLTFYIDGKQEFTDKYSYQTANNLDAPLDKTRVYAWQWNLSAQQRRLIEVICADLMRQLGYFLENQKTPMSATYIALTRLQRIIGLGQQFSHYVFSRPGYLFCILRRKALLGLLFQDISMINS